jgi:hypothetical protein
VSLDEGSEHFLAGWFDRACEALERVADATERIATELEARCADERAGAVLDEVERTAINSLAPPTAIALTEAAAWLDYSGAPANLIAVAKWLRGLAAHR